jgi:superfamily II DNA helicase RecQ
MKLERNSIEVKPFLVIVATITFGMEIDKASIRNLAHFHISGTSR